MDDAPSSHNASGDSDAADIPGTNSVTSVVSGDFVDSSQHPDLASGSALIDAGTDLSSTLALWAPLQASSWRVFF